MVLKESLYCVFDKVSGTLSHFVSATSDGLAVRQILLTLEVPLHDTVCLCFGTLEKSYSDFDMSSVNLDWSKILCFNFCDVREVSWSCYKFPADLAEALAPLGASSDEINAIMRAQQEKVVDKE